ncbi:MAG TPA: sodium:proton antiporter [candidate division Zixibacteria bacterium]|nr:sodium:proton antiporter [candidate division Zixibacteria bacterium]
MSESLSIYSSIPFVVLLLLIALMPLALPKFWDKNKNKAIATAIVSLPILIYLLLNFKVELVHNIKDYISFIILLASLFIVSGGILMKGDLRATPAVNAIFLAIGAVIANVIGTTGASMLLIRPLLKTNSERKFTAHIPVFFIFLVSNIGGCLTPLGDPPLFLGYLRGVPFTWTLSLWPEWLVMLVIVLAVFYIWDRLAYARESKASLIRDVESIQPLGVSGKINFLFLAGVVLAVFFQTPAPWREVIMGIMAVLSLIFTSKENRKQNGFTFYPISEVAILFAGIFVTMVPVLMMLHENGASLGVTKPWQYFWWTGGLSSLLDNAPTYLTFFTLGESVTAKMGAMGNAIISGVQVDILRAISCGAVFMGANTYIGNGPNFMVKSIAEEQGYKVPHFFGYMAYSAMILIPAFVIVTLIFFRG